MPLTEYVIQYLTQNNDLTSQEGRVKFLNEVEPIINEMASEKLAFLFKKRISVLLDLTLNEIDNLIKVKNKITSKAPIQQLNRQTTSVVKRFVILLILNPKLIEKSDKDISWGESLDEQLAQACISKILVDEKNQ